MFHNAVRVKYIVNRLNRFLTRPSGFAVMVLRVAHLNVGTVTQHDVRQLGGSFRAEYRAVESVFIGKRNHARMVNMCVRQKNIVDVGIFDRQFRILIKIFALFHSHVYGNLQTAGVQ